jgi:hypothetical protein
MTLTHEEKLGLMRSLNWGYSTVSSEDMLDVIEGRKEGSDPVWGFNRTNLFVLSLERLPWHYVVALWGVETMKQLYTAQINARIWPPSRRDYFDRAFKLLRGEPYESLDSSPSTGWSPEYRKTMQHTILSHWRHSLKPGVLPA